MRKMFGFSIVEALLASAIFGILTIGLVSGFIYGLESTMLAGNRARATLLAEEGLEATRNIRDNNYLNLTDGAHGLTTSGNTWAFSGTSNTIGLYSRVIEIGTLDADRKVVTSTVTWQQNPVRTGTVQIVTRLTNWFKSVGASAGNWTTPSLEASVSVSGYDNGSKVMGQGNYAYMVREGGTPDFVVIDISTPGSPSIVGSLSLIAVPTNIYVSGNYAYVSSQNDNQELQIIDISTPATPVVVGTYDDSGTSDALGVFVSGNYAYLTLVDGNNLVSVNISNPASPSFAHGLNLYGGANEVFIIGNYAYIASTSDTEELQVINISTPTNMNQIGSINLSGTDDSTTVSGFDSTILVGRVGGQLEIINVSTPSSPLFVGSYNAASPINDISMSFISSNSYAAIATDFPLNEFQVINISTPSSPTLYGADNQSANLNGIWYDSLYDRVYGASDQNMAEFLVIKPL